MGRESLEVLLELKNHELERAKSELSRVIAEGESSRAKLGAAEASLKRELLHLTAAIQETRTIAVPSACSVLELTLACENHKNARAGVTEARARVDEARRKAERDGAAERRATAQLAQIRAEQRAVSRVAERRRAEEAKRRENQTEEEAVLVTSFRRGGDSPGFGSA